MLPRYRVEYANVMPLCLLCRYGVKMDTEISATRLYSNGTYLYVENRLSEFKRLLFLRHAVPRARRRLKTHE